MLSGLRLGVGDAKGLGFGFRVEGLGLGFRSLGQFRHVSFLRCNLDSAPGEKNSEL